MARSVPEWIGKTDNTPAPPRVRARVFAACGGRCHRCQRKINAGERWTLEHLIALVNGGENRERDLSVTCGWCLPAKNADDLAVKAKSARVRAKHLGIRKSKWAGRGFPKADPQRSATRPIVRKSERTEV